MAFRNIFFVCTLSLGSTTLSPAQTLSDAIEWLGIDIGLDTTAFQINRESINRNFIWNVDFDTLIVTSIFNKRSQPKIEDLEFGTRTVYLAKNGSLMEVDIKADLGVRIIHRWYQNQRIVKEEHFNSSVGFSKYTTIVKYDATGRRDSMLTFADDVPEGAWKLEPYKSKQYPTQIKKTTDGKVSEATSMHMWACPCNNIFSYVGDKLKSITTYALDNPKKKVAEMTFNDMGLIATQDERHDVGSRWSRQEYNYVFDTKGRWITRESVYYGVMVTFDYRLFK